MDSKVTSRCDSTGQFVPHNRWDAWNALPQWHRLLLERKSSSSTTRSICAVGDGLLGPKICIGHAMRIIGPRNIPHPVSSHFPNVFFPIVLRNMFSIVSASFGAKFRFAHTKTLQ